MDEYIKDRRKRRNMRKLVETEDGTCDGTDGTDGSESVIDSQYVVMMMRRMVLHGIQKYANQISFPCLHQITNLNFKN